ncbi:hypothetical protein FIBSPDRAFT_882342 [Athelia psychrophila]|uniref:Uncharacterized protein n=1 Tax=Athelia psychrophila TaxID=1759441 RepID=A0A166V8V5_9AGAM|nr:hypothetical protein FIBSPDRAFT_882342 [Fibularhizoctonia sp. CBS 109695]
MYCDLREQQCPARLPGISAEALNIPRAHVVEGSRTPVPYDLGAMWARPLSTGIHVSAGDRVWVDGLGEVVLIEDGGSISTDLSQFWAFFRAQTVYNGLIYVAIEWKYVELTPDEYNLRVHTISEAGRWFRLRRCVRLLFTFDGLQTQHSNVHTLDAPLQSCCVTPNGNPTESNMGVHSIQPNEAVLFQAFRSEGGKTWKVGTSRSPIYVVKHAEEDEYSVLLKQDLFKLDSFLEVVCHIRRRQERQRQVHFIEGGNHVHLFHKADYESLVHEPGWGQGKVGNFDEGQEYYEWVRNEVQGNHDESMMRVKDHSVWDNRCYDI